MPLFAIFITESSRADGTDLGCRRMLTFSLLRSRTYPSAKSKYLSPTPRKGFPLLWEPVRLLKFTPSSLHPPVSDEHSSVSRRVTAEVDVLRGEDVEASLEAWARARVRAEHVLLVGGPGDVREVVPHVQGAVLAGVQLVELEAPGLARALHAALGPTPEALLGLPAERHHVAARGALLARQQGRAVAESSRVPLLHQRAALHEATPRHLLEAELVAAGVLREADVAGGAVLVVVGAAWVLLREPRDRHHVWRYGVAVLPARVLLGRAQLARRPRHRLEPPEQLLDQLAPLLHQRFDLEPLAPRRVAPLGLPLRPLRDEPLAAQLVRTRRFEEPLGVPRRLLRGLPLQERLLLSRQQKALPIRRL
ncbi:hypothetical protein FIBSPDRAFT_897999 [Athelia psychrophila]|uniref:Uncharacterized protein n=1 Tax=Athelia psychrophila TaxID=1759441 RepID=A0A166BKX2_9AGAM|nr:hypothetical protein FIBSPDRAFT_897999 [Fibularhizoctonia sp. CBS 109695]